MSGVIPIGVQFGPLVGKRVQHPTNTQRAAAPSPRRNPLTSQHAQCSPSKESSPSTESNSSKHSELSSQWPLSSNNGDSEALDTSQPAQSNWMSLVAQHSQNYNLLSYLRDHSIYFITIKPIMAASELIVWHSKSMEALKQKNAAFNEKPSTEFIKAENDNAPKANGLTQWTEQLTKWFESYQRNPDNSPKTPSWNNGIPFPFFRIS